MKISLLLAFTTFFSLNIRECIAEHDIFADNAVNQLREGSTRFSFELLRALNTNPTAVTESQELLFSPYSVWSALVVTYMGARGSTKQEMRNVLGIGDISKIKAWKAFKRLSYCDTGNNPANANFNSANRIYFQKGTTLKKLMQKLLHKNIAFVDFHHHSEEARRIINTWVESYTQERIKNLIPPYSIDRHTRMVIANAVYFKEEWLQPFEPENTSRRKFTTSSTNNTFVNMMSTKGTFMHGKNEAFQCSVLDIPYSDNSMSMIILLPEDGYYGIDNLVNNLTPETLRDLQSGMSPKTVMLSIPKFKIEHSYELSPVLRSMGLTTLFDEKHVNLSGFTGKRDFRLDSVRHKILIDVNEVGTEAAASTDIFYFRSAEPSESAVFNADHPFVYLIRENTADTILFIGTIRNPSEYRTE